MQSINCRVFCVETMPCRIHIVVSVMWTDAKFDKVPTRFVDLSILLARFADAEGLTY